MRLIILGVVVAIMTAACSYSRVSFDYSQYKFYSSAIAGNTKYKEVGAVTADASSFFWTPCETLLRDVSSQLAKEAQLRGGNAIMSLRWAQADIYVGTPTCRTGWGWFALYILGGFGPWVQSARAEGVVIQLSEEEKKAALFDPNVLIVNSSARR